ncbi:hypothetical protein GV827_15890 [Sulfitobacter sp. JBTF-M27]|uniref:Uncharacterized protein n=1 Tax=Sulfitobacter sediminilitoris TaxID=2698830 RepID=A0A6P0CDD1_9RHOB|nr:DUF6880 family protein [Sulfitobacter sediminilitoris]NEK23877.1 hypothetical protein [Sulfitobacter sediminilitoris]
MSKKALNKQNLVALGADRLADLCLELGEGSAEIKRRLRLELTHAAGPEALAHEVRKRIATIRRSTSYVEWNRTRPLIRDLDTQLTMIADKIAPGAPDTAFDLLWQFVELAPSVYERTDDSNGSIGDIFRDAVTRFEDLAPHIQPNQPVLAERIFAAMSDNGYGEWDGLLDYIGSALTPDGIVALKDAVDTYEAAPLPEDSMESRAVFVGAEPVGYSLDKDWSAKRKADEIRRWRQEIADLEGDVDAFLSQFDVEQLENPTFAADAATRLIAANRATEAVPILETVRDTAGKRFIPHTWDEAYVAALAALDRKEELHAFRWQRFSETLAPSYLRDLLKALPDFDDIEMEEKAKALAFSHRNFEAALGFFLDWPDRKLAADLITARVDELDGDAYHALTPAADALQHDHPLAATLCRRAMIRYTLDKARSTRYKHAIQHFAECASADAYIESYGQSIDHVAFTAELKAKHPRKSGFWSGVKST